MISIGMNDYIKLKFSCVNSAVWKNNNVRYLGIYISTDLSRMSENNLILLINATKNKLENWLALKNLSWFGWLTAMKSNILPKCVWFCPNCNYKCYSKNITWIQFRQLSTALLGVGRIKPSVLYINQLFKVSWLALPSLVFYYHAAMLVALSQQWNFASITYWAIGC